MAAFYTRGGLTLTNNLLHTGMSRVKMNGGLAPLPLTSPRSAVIFVEKAAAACAAPALKYFCSILHHNLAFTQNLGLTQLFLARHTGIQQLYPLFPMLPFAIFH